MYFTKIRKAKIALIATGLMSFFPGTYMAQAGTTTSLQLVINAGALFINVPTTGNFESLTSPSILTSSTVKLETVTVTDTRGSALTRGWTASAISTDLGTGTDTLTASSIGYSSGGHTYVSGTSSAVENGAASLVTTAPVTTVTTLTGNHIVAWRPTLSIAVPQSKNPGIYVGTLTHSVA